MDSDRIQEIDLDSLPSPCYLVDEAALEKNLGILNHIQEKSGCKILLALKAFAMFSVFPLVKTYLHGVCASSPFEARLGREEFGKLVHTYGPAYSESDIRHLLPNTDYLIFNSINQWQRFKVLIPPTVQCGLRINPEYSEIETDLYNPCAPNSRLGIPFGHFPDIPDGISGIHFHAMCEQNADTLVRIWEVVERRFKPHLQTIRWINLGGGHHITRSDYDTDLLIQLVAKIKKSYDLDVFLEPGEAVALNTGVLVASVLDIVDNSMPIAILDTSAEAHMPDVLAMPYRPDMIGSKLPGELPYTYRIAGNTCLAGDVIGDYSFDKELKIGDRVVFTDMAHYTMVKNNMFNGVNLPSIALLSQIGQVRLIKRFSYDDYRNRLS